jgi:hypothetical protein
MPYGNYPEVWPFKRGDMLTYILLGQEKDSLEKVVFEVGF